MHPSLASFHGACACVVATSYQTSYPEEPAQYGECATALCTCSLTQCGWGCWLGLEVENLGCRAAWNEEEGGQALGK